MKTVTKLISTAIIASESYLLLLAIRLVQNASPCSQAVLKPLRFLPNVLLSFPATSLLGRPENLEKSWRRQFLWEYFIIFSSTDTPNLEGVPCTDFIIISNISWGRSRFNSMVQGFEALGFADICLLLLFSHIRTSDVIMGQAEMEDVRALSIPWTPSSCWW